AALLANAISSARSEIRYGARSGFCCAPSVPTASRDSVTSVARIGAFSIGVVGGVTEPPRSVIALQLLEVDVQPVELLVPQLPESLEVRVHLLERSGAQRARAPLRVAPL